MLLAPSSVPITSVYIASTLSRCRSAQGRTMSSPTVLKAFRLDAVAIAGILWAFSAEWHTNFILFPPGHHRNMDGSRAAWQVDGLEFYPGTSGHPRCRPTVYWTKVDTSAPGETPLVSQQLLTIVR